MGVLPNRHAGKQSFLEFSCCVNTQTLHPTGDRSHRYDLHKREPHRCAALPPRMPARLAWSYDALGRVTSKSQTVGSVTKSVGYAYTNGSLTTGTTPSGQTVTYGYNGNHQVTSVAVNGTTVLNSVTYQ